jgi:hypothetical protein
MFLIGLGALLVLGGILYTARTAIWRGPLSGPESSRRPVRGTLGSRRSNLAGAMSVVQRAAARAMPRGPCVRPPDGVGESGLVTTASTVLRN